MRTRTLAFPILVLFAAACGGDSPTAPGPSYQTLAGNYAGAMAGVSQGVALDANFALTITQSAGDLTGSYSLTGVLNDGSSTADVAGTGTLFGTIASGDNPSVNITVTPGSCPSLPAHFSGTYDNANHRLTILGPVQMFDDNCNVFLTYQMTMVLNR